MKGKTLVHFHPKDILAKIIANQVLFYIFLGLSYAVTSGIFGWKPHCYSRDHLRAQHAFFDDFHPRNVSAAFLNHTEALEIRQNCTLSTYDPEHDSFWQSHPFFHPRLDNSSGSFKDFLWSPDCLHLDDINGFVFLLLYLWAILLLGYSFVVVVSRAKACLDYSATLFIIHASCSMLYMRSFPRELIWWCLVIVFATVLTLFSEIMCSLAELRPIQLGFKYSSLTSSNSPVLSGPSNPLYISFRGIHWDLPWSNKLSFKILTRFCEGINLWSSRYIPKPILGLFDVCKLSSFHISTVIMSPFVWILIRSGYLHPHLPFRNDETIIV